MTPAEISRQVARDLYTLDTQGYVVVENALSAAQVDELLEGVAHGVELDPPTANKSQDDGSSRRYSGCLRWGAPFVRLVDNPRVTPLLHGALGADVRLDHEYTHCLERNTSGTPVIRGQIHGGPGNQAGGWVGGAEGPGAGPDSCIMGPGPGAGPRLCVHNINHTL